MSALCALQDVKTYFAITSANEDDMLNALIASASTEIENYCNRTFEQASYTETRNGNGSNAMAVRQYPLVSVQGVTVDGFAVPAAGDAVSSGFVFSETVIYIRNSGRGRAPGCAWQFARGIQNVTLQYTAGYKTIPADLVQACVELVGWKRAKRQRIDKTSETLGQQQTQAFKLDGLPPSVIAAINTYRLTMLPT